MAKQRGTGERLPSEDSARLKGLVRGVSGPYQSKDAPEPDGF